MTHIWFKPVTIGDIKDLSKNTLSEVLGIELAEIGPDFLAATMPVDNRTKQPAGILHGGASVALAETLGSVAATLCIDRELYYNVGLDINANHIRSVKEGVVKGIAKPIHIGKSTHVWEIRITDAEEKLVCISRLTVAILKK